jgi:hypothetical protein
VCLEEPFEFPLLNHPHEDIIVLFDKESSGTLFCRQSPEGKLAPSGARKNVPPQIFEWDKAGHFSPMGHGRKAKINKWDMGGTDLSLSRAKLSRWASRFVARRVWVGLGRINYLGQAGCCSINILQDLLQNVAGTGLAS